MTETALTDGMAVETDFDPSATNAVYDELKGSWELNRDFAEMHLHVLRRGDHLDRFGAAADAGAREAGAQYDWRRQASMAIDHCADLINLRVDNLFRAAPQRRYEHSPYRDFLAAFLSDVDRGGTSMDEFMRRALRAHYVNGVDIVVDKQSPPPGVVPASLADERQLGLLPYLHAFGPLERLDWACDHAGRYLWARYDLGEVPAADEMADAGGGRQYLTVARDRWRLYETGGEGATTVRSGPVTTGCCPVVSWYFKESIRGEYARVPLSLLTRIAPIARYMLNLLSQGQLDLYLSVAFYAITGLDDAQRAPREITPSCSWVLPEGAGVHQLGEVVAHIAEKRQWLRLAMEAILRIGRLTGGAGELTSTASSGVQVAIERTDLDNEMRMTATAAEAVERDIVRLAVSRYKGRPVSAEEIGYSVQYNKRYVLSSADDLIRQAREFFGIGVGEQTRTLGRILLGKILDAVAKQDDARYAEALAEIERATFGEG